MMAKLADFPPEIFEAIFSVEGTSPGLIRLWKCGNKHINRLISRGCSHIDLIDLKWRSESIFPKLLLQLHSLRSLRIERDRHALVGAKSLGLLLQNLSPTLEKLELECAEAESCFLVSPPSESTIIAFPNDYAPASIEKAGPCPAQSRFWDVSSVFPKLKSLNLFGSTSHLTDAEMPFLPPTLTELHLQTNQWPKPSLLPPQLEILSLSTISSLTGEELGLLPRSLRIVNARLDIDSDDYWTLLPPALEKARFVNFRLSATNVPYLNALPLKELNALTLTLEDSLDAPWISLLPSTLTRLDFSSSNFPISAIVIKSLPRGITCLSIRCIVGEDLEEGQNPFPPKLTSLVLNVIPKGRKTCEKFMECLPKTLTSFCTYNAGNDIKIFELLPPSVTYCSISSSCVSPAHTITLPEGIRHFNAHLDCEKDLPIFVFPHALTRLSMRYFPPLELVKSLPQTLIQLFILRPVEAEIFDLLPSGLEDLHLTINGEVNTTHFERFTLLHTCIIQSGEKEAKYFRGTFPASLHNIMLQKVVEHTKILELPRSLQYLTVEIDTELTNEIIQQLPRSLRSLRLNVRGWSTVTDDARQWFPPHVEPRHIQIKNIFDPSQILPLLSSLDP